MTRSKNKPIEKIVKNIASKSPKLISSDESFKEQYKIIRSDLLKLKKDLKRGISLAKGAIKTEKERIISELSKID